MIIFLRPGEQVEVQFVAEGSTQQPASMKTFRQAVVVKHDAASHAKAGTVDENGGFVEALDVRLTTLD